MDDLGEIVLGTGSPVEHDAVLTALETAAAPFYEVNLDRSDTPFSGYNHRIVEYVAPEPMEPDDYELRYTFYIPDHDMITDIPYRSHAADIPGLRHILEEAVAELPIRDYSIREAHDNLQHD